MRDCTQRENHGNAKFETHHSTRNTEETSFLASELGDPVLQVVGSLIFLRCILKRG